MTDWAAHWNERYAGADFLYGRRPNQYLVAQRYRLGPGQRVLVAADGEGRNGVWLAEQGYRVTSVDQSAVAQEKAATLARERGVAVDLVCADLGTWSPGVAAYDAVALIFAHFPSSDRAAIHGSLARALRPGGLLILEAFHTRQSGRHSGGPRDRDLLYEPDMLRRDFAMLEPLELLEGVALLDEGDRHQGEGFVVRLVARRP